MKTSKAGIKFLEEQEGLSLVAYPDTNGTMTIGFGRTSAVGVPVKKGDKITEAQAREFLTQDIKKYEKDINNLVKVPLNQSQYDALLSWHYNTGALASSTLLKLLNQGHYSRIPNEMTKWCKETIGGKKVTNKGLVARRAREAALWVSGDTTVRTSSTSVARATPTVVNKENITWGAGIAAAVATPVAEISSVGEPIQYATALIMVAAFGIAAFMFIKRRGA